MHGTAKLHITVKTGPEGHLAHLRAVVLMQGHFAHPKDIWQCLKTVLLVTIWGQEVEQEPGMLLMHRTPFTTRKNYPAQNANSVQVEKPWSKVNQRRGASVIKKKKIHELKNQVGKNSWEKNTY